MASKPLQLAFSEHSRRWRDLLYVYPVISRRSKGLSIGVNLNPDMACNFDCVYCCVDRTSQPRVRKVDLAVLDDELRLILANYQQLFEEPEFKGIPSAYRRLNDIAFSGDGEPTSSPLFHQAVQVAIAALRDLNVPDCRIVVITDACYLTRPAVKAALAELDRADGEIWAKLDAGTENYFQLVNRPNYSLQHVLDNILDAARVRPIVIQSLFMRIDGQPPPPGEIAAYVERLRAIVASGGQIRNVQIYTVARRTAMANVTKLSPEELDSIAAPVRALGLPVETFP